MVDQRLEPNRQKTAIEQGARHADGMETFRNDAKIIAVVDAATRLDFRMTEKLMDTWLCKGGGPAGLIVVRLLATERAKQVKPLQAEIKRVTQIPVMKIDVIVAED